MQQGSTSANWRSAAAPTGKSPLMTKAAARKKTVKKAALPPKNTVAEPAARRHAGAKARAPEATRQDIIDVATREFAQNGLSGARVDEIAAKTGSSKRMIYYYFGDKDGLYLAVLEEAYRKVRTTEAQLDLEHLRPADALRRLVEFTFDHHHSNEAFIRLVMIENIHHGDYLARSKTIQELNVSAIGELERVYQRGLQAGIFRRGLTAIDLHWQISALCFFNVSNRATFSQIFRVDLNSKKALAALRAQVVEMVLRNVLKHPG